jgi:hypothetical protein
MSLLSPAQQARAEAAAVVKTSLGLPAAAIDWTYEQRIAYNKALAAYIQANPARFEAVDLNTAQIVSGKTYSGLDDTSFDWGMFGGEVVNQANDLNPFSEQNRTQSKWISLAVLAVVALGLVAYLTGRNPPTAARAK